MGNKPMYRQIAEALREKINEGELKPGDALPTESSLQEAFNVSRVTVRQALKLLTEEQIVEHSGQRHLRKRRARQLRHLPAHRVLRKTGRPERGYPQ